jgi:hypothetical protein
MTRAKPLLSLTLASVFLAGCATSPADETTTMSATADTARIRLFGQNGVGVKLYQNRACVGGKSITVSGGLGDAFASFVGTASDKSIGMPATPNSANRSKRNGILSKAFFREYVIASRQPITVTSGFASNPGTNDYVECKRIATTFTPEAGKDYEVTLEITPSLCMQVINEIHTTPDGMTLQPVLRNKAESCT